MEVEESGETRTSWYAFYIHRYVSVVTTILKLKTDKRDSNIQQNVILYYVGGILFKGGRHLASDE